MPGKIDMQFNKISPMLEDLPCGVAVLEGSSVYEAEIVYLNREMCRLTGYTKMEMRLAGAANLCRAVDEDLTFARQKINESLGNNKTANLIYRILDKDENIKFVNVRINAVPVDQTYRYYLAFNDITRQKQIEESLRQTQAMYNMATMNNDICMFEYDIKTDTFFHSATSMKVHGGRRMIVYNFKRVVLEEGWIRKSSVPDFLGLYEKLESGAKTACADIWFKNRSGTGWWCQRIVYTNIFDDDGNIIKTIGVGKNITEEINLLADKQKLNIALKNASVFVWEYDIVNSTVKMEQGMLEDMVMPNIIYDMPKAFVDKGLVYPESVSDFYRLHEMVQSGTPQVSAEVRIKDLKGNAMWLEITYDTIFDDGGNPIMAIGCAHNVSALKDMQKHYFEEIEYQENSQSSQLVSKIRANLTSNKVEYYMAEDNVSLQCRNCSWDIVLKRLADKVLIEEQRENLLELLGRETITKSVVVKPYNCSFEYQRECNDGTVMWQSLVCRAYRNPDNDDVICFCYGYDITSEKMQQLTLNKMMQLEYEEIGIIDLNSGKFQRFTLGQEDLRMKMFDSYDNYLNDYMQEYVSVEEIPEIMASCSLKRIVEELRENNMYYTSFGITIRDGQSKRKKVQFMYLDSSLRFVLLAKSDITELFIEQKQKHELLRSALVQAQQASVAKSEFLSRISHEIRTPMNAIIGMTALAEQCINKPEQVEDCLGKVKISARFLLALLNDILDMSRIESGKVVLKNRQFSFDELITGINAICREQALEKGVIYEAQLRTFIDDYYIGDAMKLQQVLINIIFNAIKFTKPGGKVQFIISQESCSDGKVQLQFTVSDTGIGISEEFLPKLFSPFEQENTGMTSQYGGTGLGLAICKNLVDLMNGSIDVHSILGVGTKFVVTVTLGVLPNENSNKNSKLPASFENWHALIVDDEIMACEQLKQLCENVSMKADWVDSGAKAIDRVRRKMIRQEFYDLVLIDWKMPEMNGAETVRCVRKVVGSAVPIIIVSAYDSADIEQLAKAAGADIILSKPVFKEDFIMALRQSCNKKTLEKPAVLPEKLEYNFTGYRTLLVEDHALNVEVAKRLLAAKHMEVEVAANGLIAIEMFVRNPNKYYDVVLMDIRMPLMDGLTAAKTIRQTSHNYAKTVPIIAMSANAFDEDVEKSRAAGMDAHLAKPINPKQLYHVLHTFIERQDSIG